MKSFHLFLLSILISNSIFSSDQPLLQQKFIIKELDYNNPQEVDGACKLFKDQIICHKTGGQNYSFMQENLNQGYNNVFHLIAKTNDNKICGFLEIIVGCNIAEYETLAVHKDYRRQSIASDLIKSAESRMPDSIKTIHTLVQHNNSDAIKCYERNGFHLLTNPLTTCMATCCPSCIDTSFFAYSMFKEISSQKIER